MMLGVHCSVAGGLEKAFDEARISGCDTMQIFSRNQRQWNAKPISDEEKKIFRNAASQSNVKISFSHCSYLINLASENEELREKSVNALTNEVIRCNDLGLNYCVLHPGAAGSQDFNTAFQNIADGLITVLKDTSYSDVMILIENTAGQGTSVGGNFENLKRISELVDDNRIGFCFDTCHAFAAGYDIRTLEGLEQTFEKLDKLVDISKLKVFHLNDSIGDLGSHLDRHDHIGKGKLGIEPFRYIMNEFKNVPKIIETAKEDNWDSINLEILRSLYRV